MKLLCLFLLFALIFADEQCEDEKCPKWCNKHGEWYPVVGCRCDCDAESGCWTGPKCQKCALPYGGPGCKTHSGFSELISKIDEVSEKVKKLEQAQSALGQKVDSLKEDVTKIASKADSIDQQVKKIDAITEQIKKLDVISEQVKKLDSITEQIKKLDVISEQVKKLDAITEQVKKLDVISEQIKKLDAISEQIKKLDAITEQVKKIDSIIEEEKNLGAKLAALGSVVDIIRANVEFDPKSVAMDTVIDPKGHYGEKITKWLQGHPTVKPLFLQSLHYGAVASENTEDLPEENCHSTSYLWYLSKPKPKVVTTILE